jgi:leader peptidase (prepilin peptidase)/N-methyltransferase
MQPLTAQTLISVVACAVLGAVAGALWPRVAASLARGSVDAEAQPGWTTRASGPLPLAVLGAVACGAAGLHAGADPQVLPELALCLLLIGVVAADLRYRIVPNRIVAIGTPLGLALGIAIDPSRWLELLVAVVVSSLLLLIACIVYPAGLGMGDVKLVAMLGAFLGKSVIVAVVAGLAFACLPSLGIVLLRGLRAGRKTSFALGPFLALGAFVAVLVGPELLHWYVHRSLHQ